MLHDMQLASGSLQVHDRFRDFSQGPDGGFEITD